MDKPANGEEELLIRTSPRDGMNAQVLEVGRNCAVIKYHGGTNDKPRWPKDDR
jgi:hypothetical protein